MKPISVSVLILTAILMTSCSSYKPPYQRGYDEGYEAGYVAAGGDAAEAAASEAASLSANEKAEAKQEKSADSKEEKSDAPAEASTEEGADKTAYDSTKAAETADDSAKAAETSGDTAADTEASSESTENGEVLGEGSEPVGDSAGSGGIPDGRIISAEAVNDALFTHPEVIDGLRDLYPDTAIFGEFAGDSETNLLHKVDGPHFGELTYSTIVVFDGSKSLDDILNEGFFTKCSCCDQ
ncbi:MAG: hypothetical protein K6E34_10795 [Lachnospiraceae bacterium]|nr:hypothetical protein [Lachnospiraceae bacterium]